MEGVGAIDRKELENSNQLAANSLTSDATGKDREGEDRERIALEIKAGLHPLKVFFCVFPFNFFFFFLYCVD